MAHIGGLLSDIAKTEGWNVAQQTQPVLLQIVTKPEGVKVTREQAHNMPCYSTLIKLHHADYGDGRLVATSVTWKKCH